MVIALTVGAMSGASHPAVAAEPGPFKVTNYTDPAQAMKWGNRSHWMQPWRSYLETVPASTLLNAVGINFNVPPTQASATARLLADSGFTRARIEVGWGTLDYADPNQMSAADRANLLTTLTALDANGIRPLIVLNANHGKPCPVSNDSIGLASAASMGARTLLINPTDIDKIVPGKTGINANGIAAENLFTSVDPSGLARLSKPLVSSLTAGPLTVTTLRYEPFRPALLADGSPDPRFEQTMQGWLNYVGVVTREAESILGSEDFDVEVWNELGFGSRFLNFNAYYEPDVEWTDIGNRKAILERTIGFIRDPANGVPSLGIGNGFSNQTPWPSGTTSPIGLTAIDKHPYSGWFSFPSQGQVNGNRPLDGLGQLSGWKDSNAQYHETFTPTYDSFFPEHFLSGIQTETLVHDLSPITSGVGGEPHGRFTHPDGGEPPELWITEVNLRPTSGPTPAEEMSPEDVSHVASKNVLRYLTAYVNKGVTALDLFAAADDSGYGLIDNGFFEAITSSDSSPDNSLGGETMAAVRRLTDSMRSSEPMGPARSLSLKTLTDFSGNFQFEGDGSSRYPPLYNREVFAFLPFQVDSHRFVIPVYVMTRNTVEVYDAGSDRPTRFDMPPERYRMTIGGLNGSEAVATASDPLTGVSVPVQTVSRSSKSIVVEMPVTDSPRLLAIDERPGVDESPPVEEGPQPVEEGPQPVEESPEPVEEGPEPVEEDPEPVEGAPQPLKPQPLAAAEEVESPPSAGRESSTANPELTANPQVTVRSRGARKLFETGHMTVVARCDRPCEVVFGGGVLAAGRWFELDPRKEGPVPAGSDLRAATGASFRGAAVRIANRELAQGRTVRIRLIATAVDQLAGGTASRAIRLRGESLDGLFDGIQPGR